MILRSYVLPFALHFRIEESNQKNSQCLTISGTTLGELENIGTPKSLNVNYVDQGQATASGRGPGAGPDHLLE